MKYIQSNRGYFYQKDENGIKRISKKTYLNNINQLGGKKKMSGIKIIIFGAPNSGKIIQTKQISRNFNIPLIQLGNSIKNIAKKKNKFGNEIKNYINERKSIPDPKINKIIENTLKKENCKINGFVLNGYPTNIEQCMLLDKTLTKLNCQIDCAIEYIVPFGLLKQRMTKRIMVSKRADVLMKKFNSKLSNYKKTMKSIRKYYKDKGTFKQLDATSSQINVINETNKIINSLNRVNKRKKRKR